MTTKYGEALISKDIDAVAIATPATTHYKLAKESILAGKDVFVEKPLSITTKEAQELVDLADAKNKILMVGHILQYHPAVIKLKELINNGDLGKIQYIYSNRLNIGKLRTEENILWSFAPHDISVILMLIGEEPLRVNSFGGDYLNHGINDVTMTAIEFRNGVKGHIFVSWLHPYKEQRLVVVGSKAMAVFDDVSKEKLFLYPHTIEWGHGKIPLAQKAEHKVIAFDEGEPLRLELQHFIECIKTRKAPKTDGNEGLRVLKVLEQAETSVTAGSKVQHGPYHLEGSRQTLCHSEGALPALNEGEGNVRPKNLSAVTIHPTSCIDENVKIGENTQIWHFSHIIKGSTIGKNCRIGQNVVIGPKVKIGDNCKIQNNVSIYEGIMLEDNVFCGPSCVFTNVSNPRSEVPRMKELKTTLVKRGVSIGANATIVCGNILGRYCFIGAGAVVTKDVPDYALIYGNPAKIMGWMCECGVKLIFKNSKSKCSVCKKEYTNNKGKVKSK